MSRNSLLAVGCACLALAGCNRPVAPPPTSPSDIVVDPAAAAFSSPLPDDARRIGVPSWATLLGVWGLYDPPFVTEPHEVAAVTFSDRDRQLVVLRRTGELLFWDRVFHATLRRLRACSSEPAAHDVGSFSGEPARVLVTSASERFAAIGFASGRYCLLDLKTGKKTAEFQANRLDSSREGIMLAQWAGGRLVTYAYQPATSYETSFRSIGIPEAGGEFRSWDAGTGKMLSDARVGGALDAALSPDGERLALVTMKQNVAGKLMLVDKRGRVLWTTDERATSVAFAGNEALLVSDGERLFTLSAADGTVLGFLEGSWRPSRDYPWRGVVVTPNGGYAVTTFGDGRFALWDLMARREVAHEHRDALQQPSLHHAVASHDGALFVARDASIFATARVELVDAPSGPIDCLAISGDGERALACHGHRRARVFDVWDARRRELRRWPRGDAAGVSIAPDGTRVLVRQRESNELRDWATGRVLWSVPHYLWAPAAIAPESNRVALLVWNQRTNGFDTTLREAATGRVIWTNEVERAGDRILSFSPDGQRVLIRDVKGRLVVLDATKGVLQRRGALPDRATSSASHELAQAVFADGRRALVTGGYGETIDAYDVDTGKRIWRSHEKAAVVEVAAIPRAERFVAIAKRSIWLRSLKTGKDVAPPIDLGSSDDEPRHVAVSADGRILMVGTQRGVLLRFRLTLK